LKQHFEAKTSLIFKIYCNVIINFFQRIKLHCIIRHIYIYCIFWLFKEMSKTKILNCFVKKIAKVENLLSEKKSWTKNFLYSYWLWEVS